MEEKQGAWTGIEPGEPVMSRGMGPALAYCDAVRVVYEKLSALKPGLRLAAITAVTELLADEP